MFDNLKAGWQENARWWALMGGWCIVLRIGVRRIMMETVCHCGVDKPTGVRWH